MLTTFGSTLPRVGRLIQLQQVIINLLVNSVQSITQEQMPGSTSRRRSMKRLGVFSFFGNGPGIASANLDPSLTASSGPRKRE